jgi:NAD+ kinase
MEKAAIISVLEKGKLKKILLKKGFIASNYKPDFVVCYGGDGTALFAERAYPGVPKLLVKSTHVFRKYDYKLSQLENLLEKVKKDELKIVEEPKLSAGFDSKKVLELNEVQVHTCKPTRAIRFSVFVGKKKFKGLIGDGVIVATPFGSTGYYHSAGGRPFKRSIGIAFNNVCQRIKPFTIPDSKKVKIKIEREKSWLLFDNYEKLFELREGDTIEVRRSKEVAKFIAVS